MTAYRPLIVGMGGTTRAGSSSERVLAVALRAAEAAGARTTMFDGPSLMLPLYTPNDPQRTEGATALVESLRQADGILIASPGYHGSVSGLIKNALDYAEDLANDARVYFDGKAVGLIACAYGWQATGSTMAALRSITHALRGWPTPLGVTINSAGAVFDDAGEPIERAVRDQLALLGRQVVDFALHREAYLRTHAIGA